MKAAIHYTVKIKLIRPSEDDTIDFIESEQEFKDDSPIIARENAFRYYQNYIDVLLQGKNKKYISDKETRKELQSFIDHATSTKVKIFDHEYELNDSYSNGIGIFMVIDTPIEDKIFNDKIEDEFLIHAIGRLGWSEDPQYLMDALNHEYLYYEHFNYSTKNYEQVIEFYDYDGATTDSNRILKTPFDWTGLDVPEIEYSLDNDIDDNEAQTIEQLISRGEGNQIEFKPALLYNFSTEQAGISIKNIIAKAICAFLNSNGGFLFIGVNDNGNIQGLDFDFKLAGNENPKDFFQKEFDQMLKYFLSFSVNSNVVGQFYEVKGKIIYIVTVTPNKRRPIFLKGQKGKEFYIRGAASTRQLIDIEEIVNYCIDRWLN